MPSPLGPLGLAATDDGLLAVAFHAGPGAAGRIAGRLGAPPAPQARAAGCHALLADASEQLTAYFAGRRQTFALPLDWTLTSGFHRRVLRALHTHVPYGTVATYQDLADLAGEPGAARAVGVAMSSNPLPVVVPCHRVVESGGGLGGFTGGLDIKRTLLSLEGFLPEPLF
nr:methylated-DNA--[protein]-cysteine S-methyltransferase [Streptomyces mashuensis]